MNTLKLTEIVPDANQPRKYFAVEKMKSLKDSVKRHGVITPIVVQKEGDKYLLIDGERRYRVSKELGLKDIPVQIVASKNPFDRLIEQFHIQEQHAEWSSTEKALAILEISKISKKPLQEVCELLSIEQRAVRSYLAFAKLQDKDRFVEHQISLRNAEKIQETKNAVKSIKEKVLEEPFTRAQELKLEKILVNKVSDGSITGNHSYTQLKDSFRSDPKLIDQFMTSDFDISENFVRSNAKGSYHLRNAITNGSYFIGHANAFLEDPNIKLLENDILMIKRVVKAANAIINLVE